MDTEDWEGQRERDRGWKDVNQYSCEILKN